MKAKKFSTPADRAEEKQKYISECCLRWACWSTMSELEREETFKDYEEIYQLGRDHAMADHKEGNL